MAAQLDVEDELLDHNFCQEVYPPLVRAATVCQAWHAAALEAARHFSALILEPDMPADLLASVLAQRMAASVRSLFLEVDAQLYRRPGFRQFLHGCSALEHLTVHAAGGAVDALSQAFLESATVSMPLTQLTCASYVPVAPLPCTLAELVVRLSGKEDRADADADALRLQLLLVNLQSASSVRCLKLSGSGLRSG